MTSPNFPPKRISQLPLAVEASPDSVVVGVVDGTTYQIPLWVITNSLSISGEIKLYGGALAPTGWMVCDGSAISREVYATLFEVLGTAYGAGDGTTTFNIPDLRGAAPIGVDERVATAATGTISTTTPISVTATVAGTLNNGRTITVTVNAAAANPTNTVIIATAGTAAGVTFTFTPNNGTNNGGIPVSLTSAEFVQWLNTGAVTGKTVTTSGSGAAPRKQLTATGGGGEELISSNGTLSGGVDGVPRALGAAGGNVTIQAIGASSTEASRSQNPWAQGSILSSCSLPTANPYSDADMLRYVPMDRVIGSGDTGDLTDNNMPPFTVVNYIIKT